jgi:hypothetical protein
MTNIFLKHCDLLGCNAMKCGDNHTFQRNILPPSSGVKSKPSKKPAEAGSKQTLLGGNMFLQNAGLNYTALQPKHHLHHSHTGIRITNPAIQSY